MKLQEEKKFAQSTFPSRTKKVFTFGPDFFQFRFRMQNLV